MGKLISLTARVTCFHCGRIREVSNEKGYDVFNEKEVIEGCEVIVGLVGLDEYIFCNQDCLDKAIANEVLF